MPTALEYSFLTRIIDDHNFRAVEQAQITPEFFESSETRQIFEFIRDIYHNPETAGIVPSRAAVMQRFGPVPFNYPDDEVALICTMMRRKKLRLDLHVKTQQIRDIINTDPYKALAELKQLTTDLTSMTEIGEDISLAASGPLLRERYNIIASSKGVVGIPYPWEVLNKVTHGMQGGQFIVFYGRPKNMKSFVALCCAVHAYIAARRRVLFFTREMPPLQVLQRVACLIAKVDYEAYSGATLQPSERDRIFEILDSLAEDEKNAVKLNAIQPYLIVTSDKSDKADGGGGVNWINAKIGELKPDLLIVDGMYLLKDDRTNRRTIDWKQIAHISQDLKRVSQNHNIPVIGVTQANRVAEKQRGEDLTELAYADSLGQDADAVFRVLKHFNEETHRMELLITCPGIREGKLDGFWIQGEPCTSFDYLRSFTFSGEKVDREGSYDPDKAPRRGPRKSGTSSIPTSATKRSVGAQTAFHSGSTYRAPAWKGGVVAQPPED